MNAALTASAEQQREAFHLYDIATEEGTAACMAQAGFDYTPVLTDTTGMFEPSPAQLRRSADRDWVAGNGWGIVGPPPSPEDVAHYQETKAAEAAGAYDDPNDVYAQTLSQAGAVQYYKALYGPTAVFEDGRYQGSEATRDDPATWGCQMKATTAAWNAAHPNPTVPGTFDALSEAVDAFWAELAATIAPTLTALDDEWSRCMTDAGYPGYASEGEAIMAISRQLDDAVQATGANYFTVLLTDEGQVVRDAEISLSLASFDCKESIGYNRQVQELSGAEEKQFVQDHLTELEAYKLWAEQQPW
jgi:hypothetical protein